MAPPHIFSLIPRGKRGKIKERTARWPKRVPIAWKLPAPGVGAQSSSARASFGPGAALLPSSRVVIVRLPEAIERLPPLLEHGRDWHDPDRVFGQFQRPGGD